ncbi:MAG: hypothetical protein NTW69_06945 [Chloroflexi bacterium]|nr:hypothetical protein [Chloroflexota bacterium]
MKITAWLTSPTLRQVGAKPASALKSLFETLATGADPAPAGLSSMDRFIRMGQDSLSLGLAGQLRPTGFYLFSAAYSCSVPCMTAVPSGRRWLTNSKN